MKIFKEVLNAWQVLQDKMSKIQAVLHESRHRAEKLNPPANRVILYEVRLEHEDWNGKHLNVRNQLRTMSADVVRQA